ncbi:hypothetical protein Anas_09669 [Armadillidium nasatum]|uniref:Uncharacterized protein n=1 Tax=Armadillidium nasatum TaxID=96803 RepID=A0A5N5SSC4_9CRUS|nr:hypothetical protein Anas_09669 [Armadillidium nasatum]
MNNITKDTPEKQTSDDSVVQEMSPKDSPKHKAGKVTVSEEIDNEQLTINDETSKKQKIENNKIDKEKLKTKHQEEEKGKSLIYKVLFPAGGTCYKEIIQKVISSSESVMRPGWFTIKFASQEEAEQKTTELKKLSVGDSNLIVKPMFKPLTSNPLKRTIFLSQNFKDLEQLKIFFGATAVEQSFSSKGNLSNKFVLLFESEAKADAASKKSYNFGSRNIELTPILERSQTKEEKRVEKQIVVNQNRGKKRKQNDEQDQKKPNVKKRKRKKGNKQSKRLKTELENDDKDEEVVTLETMKFHLDFKGDKDDDDEEEE